MDAEVTVLPVPGGPCTIDNAFCSTDLTANTCEWLSSGKPGAPKRRGKLTRNAGCSTSWPSNRW